MNIKLIALASAVAVSSAVAQDYDEFEESVNTPAQEEAAPAPAPAPAAPVYNEPAAAPVAEAQPAAAPAAGLNVLHGVAYNTVGNEAAASTVRGNIASPYKMAGSNLFYVEPSGEYGALALTSGAMTYLLAFDNYASLGLVTAGIATGNMGVTLELAIDKKWASEEVTTGDGSGEGDASITGINDHLAATFAMNLGAMDFTARAYWDTYKQEIDTETETGSDDNDYWNLGVTLGLSNGPSGSTFAWSAGLWFQRHTDFHKTEDTDMAGAKVTTEATGKEANITIQPYFNFGFPVFSTADARVLFGMNTRLPLVFFDELDNKNRKIRDSYSIYALYTTPNIFAEMALNENWIIFGGAAFEWEVFSYASDEYETNYDASNNKETTDLSIIGMKTNSTTATAGARFQYKNLSIEASVADNLGSSAWSGLIGSFSGTLTF